MLKAGKDGQYEKEGYGQVSFWVHLIRTSVCLNSVPFAMTNMVKSCAPPVQRPYDNWDKIMFDCTGQDFKTVMSAIDSNNPRWGINDVTLVLKREQS